MEQRHITRQALAEQLAYYFSDDNLVTDEYLQWHFACHGWELPLLMVAPFKLVDRYLRELGVWSSLEDRLTELQLATRACPELELCSGGASVRRRTPIAPKVIEMAEAAAEAARSIAAAEAEEAAASGTAAEPRTTFKAVLLPLTGRLRVLRLRCQPDYLHVLGEAAGSSSLLPIALGSKAREAVGVRVFARVDPADADAAAAAAAASPAAAAPATPPPLNALASELAGVAVRGAAVVANVHLRRGRLLALDTGLAETEAAPRVRRKWAGWARSRRRPRSPPRGARGEGARLTAPRAWEARTHAGAQRRPPAPRTARRSSRSGAASSGSRAGGSAARACAAGSCRTSPRGPRPQRRCSPTT
jgi:hypothetical protein